MNRHQLYNNYKRDQEAKRFYNSKVWEICRTNVLIRDFYLCQECLKNKLIVVYDVVHHIKPRKLFPKLALVEENLISVCHACHNRLENNQETSESGINIVESGANQEII